MQPDTIIPNPSNPQSWNRFSYVQNNPIGYSDQTGHMRTDENGSSRNGCSDKNYCQPDEELKSKKGGGGVCTQCHTDGPPQIPQDPNSDWNSGKYGGCFMCHAAQAYNQTTLTNSQLSAYSETLHGYAGYYGMAMVGGAVIGAGLGLSATAVLGGGATCVTNTECLTTVDDMFEGASNIADDAYVAIHPAAANASIAANGLDPAAAQSEYVYVTQMQYIRNVDLATAADNLVVDAAKWTSQPVT